MNDLNLIFGEPYKITEGVYFKIPKVEEMIKEDNFALYTTLFTIRTREMFTTAFEVDALEKKFPSLYEIYENDETDQQAGRYFGDYDRVSDAIIEALKFWIIFTNLPDDFDHDGEDGFLKLSNGKIIHGASEWIFDRNAFFQLSELIKTLIAHKYNDELVAPKISSKSQHEAWLQTYKGRVKKLQRNVTTLGDKILILSISADAYIPIREIQDMTVYTFNKLFNGLSAKDSYDKEFLVRLSPNFKVNGNLKKSWKETWKHL